VKLQEVTFPVTKLLVGKGSLSQLSSELTLLGAKRILVVVDKALCQMPIFQAILEQLQGFSISIYAEIQGDPDIETVELGLEQCKSCQADFLLSVGGGSAIDAAKAISILATNEGPIRSFEGIDKFSNQPLPTIAIPTTAGTGSEVSPAAVVTDNQEKLKFTLRSWRIAPKIAILDPDLLISLPAKLAAATGMDALCHNLEYYLAKSASPLSEGINLRAIEMVGKNLRAFVADRSDSHAATEMHMSSMMGEISFALLRLSVNHAIAHPLGARFKMHHGLACGIMLPYALRFNMDYCLDKLPNVAAALGADISGLNKKEAALTAIEAVESLKADIGVPKGLKEFGIQKSDLEVLSRDAMKSTQLVVNPRPVSQQDIYNILEQAIMQ
jgi:alcohol dehydrogenase class IV